VAPPVAGRTDDLVIVAGQAFHIGAKVVTWSETAGLNAYDFKPSKKAGTENRGVRRLAPAVGEDSGVEPRASWDLAGLQEQIDQFVLHYDSEGFSRRTFAILQQRGLSAHFLLDVDGTIYQTLDLRERAYHATVANSRSIGIEIANLGAYPREETKELHSWYVTDDAGNTLLRPPVKAGATGVLTPNFIAHPARPQSITGVINGYPVEQYDFTPEQYAALIKLTAALHRIFPRIKLDYPRDSRGQLAARQLAEKDYENFHGVLGHWHIQANKVDPGPAMQWDRVIEGARAEVEAKE